MVPVPMPAIKDSRSSRIGGGSGGSDVGGCRRKATSTSMDVDAHRHASNLEGCRGSNGSSSNGSGNSQP